MMKEKKIKKITYFTGSRAEYGTMRLLLRSMAAHPDFKLNLIVSGTHLSDKHGYTINEIKKDKFEILAEIDILGDDLNEKRVNPGFVNNTFMAKAFGRCVMGVAEVLSRNKPDFFMVQGDRSEALAAAIAASHLNIPIVHLSGGDITLGGTIDDRIRPALSDFAHLHFPSTKRSAGVLIKRGEEPWRVHFVGNPGVNLNREPFTAKEELSAKLGIDLNQGLVVVIQHPIEPEHAEKQMEETMAAVKELSEELKLSSIVIYPNSDTGSESIIKVINKYAGKYTAEEGSSSEGVSRKSSSLIKTFKALSRPDFIGLLKSARVLVGNSSCGIAEAPSLNLSVVNIGTRQSGREMLGNILNVDHDKGRIKEAIRKALNLKSKIQLGEMPYYGENTEQEIIKVLQETEPDQKLLRKGVIL